MANSNSDKKQILRRHAIANCLLKNLFFIRVSFWQFKLNNEIFCYCLNIKRIVSANAVNYATIAEFLIRLTRYSTAQLRMKINPKGAFRGSGAGACDVGFIFTLSGLLPQHAQPN